MRARVGVRVAASMRSQRAKGIRDKPIAPGSPWQNGFAEGLIGSEFLGLDRACGGATLERGVRTNSAVLANREIAICAAYSRRALAVIRYAKIHGTKHRPWLTALLARRPSKVAAIALANKIARMAWAMMAKGDRYKEPIALAA